MHPLCIHLDLMFLTGSREKCGNNPSLGLSVQTEYIVYFNSEICHTWHKQGGHIRRSDFLSCGLQRAVM